MPENRVNIELGLMEVAEVASLGVALAVDDLDGFELNRERLNEHMTTNPHVVAELLSRACCDLGRAAEQMRAWCNQNPEESG